MAYLNIAILGISLLLYVLLGGADFGGGILELVTGRKKMDIITKSIAPIWEANHIWLILVVVILFVGFSPVYSTIMLTLHIPVLLVLIGIIFRGAAFSFRTYDIDYKKPVTLYSTIFKASSIFTPFFLGVALGAIMLGDITTETSDGFYAVFLHPWLNFFCFSMGLFIVNLFAFLASSYVMGESKEKSDMRLFRVISKVFLIILVLNGGLVFAASEIDGLHLVRLFLKSPISMVAMGAATICIPFMWKSLQMMATIRIRIIAVIQTFLIITGWFAIQFPVFIRMKDEEDITLYNAQAPYQVQLHLFIALAVGVFIIFPAFGYLFKTFKFSKEKENAVE